MIMPFYEYEILETKNIKEKFLLKEQGYSVSLKVSHDSVII